MLLDASRAAMHSRRGIVPIDRPCSLLSFSPNRTLTMQHFEEPLAPAPATEGELALGSCIGLPSVPTSNQAIQPMVPARYFAALLATNPAHG